MFEQDYKKWTSEDLVMWLKSVSSKRFLAETHITLMPMIEKNKISGKNLHEKMTFGNLTKNKVFGTIFIDEREKFYYEICRLERISSSENVSFWCD